MNTLRSLLEFDALWRTAINSGIVSDVCKAGLLMLFSCFAIKLVVLFLYEKKPFTAQTIFPLFLALSVWAVIISPAVYPSFCDVVASIFKAFTGLSDGWLLTAKKQLDGVMRMIAESEKDAVSFFNVRDASSNALVSIFSMCLHLTVVVMFASLILGPIYLFMCLVSGPLVIAMSFMLGTNILNKWFMMIIASILIHVSVGIAYLVISDTGSLAAVNTFVGGADATALEMALVMLILCIVLIMAVPLIHGYLFEAPFFYVLPTIIAAVVAIKSVGLSLVTVYSFYKQTKKKTNEMKGGA